MEIINDNNNNNNTSEQFENNRGKAKIFAGIAVVGAGTLLLLRKSGVEIPHWIFSWASFFLLAGIYNGIKHSFRNFSWLILMGIGAVFMVDELVTDIAIRPYLWPIVIIGAGLFIIFKPKKKYSDRFNKRCGNWKNEKKNQFSDDYLEASAVFGSVIKNIISKDFKGGEINSVFGGSEINLSQADIQGRVELEVNCVFGGVKLVVPSHWEIKSELAAVLGSVEDKRGLNPNVIQDPNKVLILRGNAVFGGIEIKSF